MKQSQYKVAAIISGNGTISGILNSKPFSLPPDHAKYQQAKEALKKRDYRTFDSIVNVAAAVNRFGKGKVRIQNGEVTFNGTPLVNTMTKRVLALMQEGFTVDPLLRFMENLLQNPEPRAVEELYLFLESGTLPITEDGYFLAYKKVNNEFKSIHASPDGTHIDHSIGSTPKMDRKEVDPDRNTTCSKGLHFCSLGYLANYGSSFGGDRVVIVKINPKDVIAIPSDYKNTKGRACEYTVIAEHTEGDKKEAFTAPVYSAPTTGAVGGKDFGLKPSGQRFWNRRGAGGKFVKN